VFKFIYSTILSLKRVKGQSERIVVIPLLYSGVVHYFEIIKIHVYNFIVLVAQVNIQISLLLYFNMQTQQLVCRTGRLAQLIKPKINQIKIFIKQNKVQV